MTIGGKEIVRVGVVEQVSSFDDRASQAEVRADRKGQKQERDRSNAISGS